MSADQSFMQKGERLRIVAGYSEFKGNEYFDIRQYAKEKGGENFVPTPSGCNVPYTLDSLQQLRDLVVSELDSHIAKLQKAEGGKKKSESSTPSSGRFIAKARIDGVVVKTKPFKTLSELSNTPASELFGVSVKMAKTLKILYYRVSNFDGARNVKRVDRLPQGFKQEI